MEFGRTVIVSYVECNFGGAGMSKLIETVEAVVRDVLGATSLKDSMTSADVHDLLHEVRRRIETCSEGRTASHSATTHGLYRFMLPDSDTAASQVDTYSHIT